LVIKQADKGDTLVEMSTIVVSADRATRVVCIGMIAMKERANAIQRVEVLGSQNSAWSTDNYLYSFCGSIESLGPQRKRVTLDFGNVFV
jgi:hypothetical protein